MSSDLRAGILPANILRACKKERDHAARMVVSGIKLIRKGTDKPSIGQGVVCFMADCRAIERLVSIAGWNAEAAQMKWENDVLQQRLDAAVSKVAA